MRAHSVLIGVGVISAACEQPRLSLPVVEGARTVVLLEIDPRRVVANDLEGAEAVRIDVEAGHELHAAFFLEAPASLGLEPGTVTEPSSNEPFRLLPNPAASFVATAEAGGPELWVSTAEWPEVHLPSDTVESCIARGGCYDRASAGAADSACVAPCPSSRAPVTFEPVLPTGLGTCTGGWTPLRLQLGQQRTADVCEPFPGAPRSACPVAMLRLPGSTECEPIASCPAALGLAAAYVDAAVTEVGDGTSAKPFATINEALAIGAPTIAIAAGRYVEDLSPVMDVELWGSCSSEVEIAGDLGSAHALLLRDLRVTGAGVNVEGPELVIEHAQVEPIVSSRASAVEIRRSVLGALQLDGSGGVTIADSEIDTIAVGPAELVGLVHSSVGRFDVSGTAQIDHSAIDEVQVRTSGTVSGASVVMRGEPVRTSTITGRLAVEDLWSTGRFRAEDGGRIELKQSVIQGLAPHSVALSIATATASLESVIIEGVVVASGYGAPLLSIDHGLLIAGDDRQIIASGSSRVVARDVSLYGNGQTAIRMQDRGGDLPDELERIDLESGGRLEISGARGSAIRGLRGQNLHCGAVRVDISITLVEGSVVTLEDLDLVGADDECLVQGAPRPAIHLINGVTRIARFRIRGFLGPGVRAEVTRSTLEDGDYAKLATGIEGRCRTAELADLLVRPTFTNVDRHLVCLPE